jgi:hydroxyacylglutathione hydrolase
MIDVRVLSTPELGDRSYLLHDGTDAVVIDPQRDIDRVLAAAAEEGVRIAGVAETHIHNDYVSGGWSLSQLLGVPYLVAAGESVSFEHQAVHHGDEIRIGQSFSLRVMATPGHTPHHVSYVALENGRPASVCTGGSMLFGSADRTDLFGFEHARALACQQFRSVQQLGHLPGWVAVLPTHGFGSFCAAGAAIGVESSTIGQQRLQNLVFRSRGENAFARALLGSLTPYPTYFHDMPARNLDGPSAPDLSPPLALNGGQLRAAVCSTAWVVDVRPRAAFASAHVHRTINIEHGMQFTTHLGWLLPRHTPLVLVGETEEAMARVRHGGEGVRSPAK